MKRRRFWFAPLLLSPLALGVTFFAARQLGLLSAQPPRTATAIEENERRARETARSTSLARALEKLDAQTLSAYYTRFSNPDAPRTRANSGQTAFVDAETLARRHPAWQLANELENGAPVPAAAREPELTRLDNSRQNVGANGNNSANSGVSVSGPRRLVARSQTGGSDRSFVDEFLALVAIRDAARRRDDELLAFRALENDLRYAERARVEAIDFAAVSPEVALELINLRLELGRNIANTDEARARARARIREIEARLNAIWERQTAEGAERLRVALEEGPARLRREGLARLEAETREQLNRDIALRADLRADLQRLIDARSNPPLALVLPAARVPQTRSFVDERAGANFSANFLETRAGASPSQAPQTSLTSGARATNEFSDEIARLRATARREARRFSVPPSQGRTPRAVSLSASPASRR